MTTIKLQVNGTPHDVEVDAATPLLFVLRNEMGLTGTKLGCGLEQCGACTVLVDGEPVLSCVRAVSEFAGNQIQTVEGLAENGNPNKVQQAFIAENAAQCGYCTSGLIIATTALMERNPKPSRSDINEALADHLCRCGSHVRVLKAIEKLSSVGGSDDR